MHGRRRAALLVVILLVAVGVRIAAGLVETGVTGPDAGRYHGSAVRLLEGRGFGTTYSPPAYSLLIAMVYELLGRGNALGVRVAQAVVWGITIFFIFQIARRVYSDEVGLIAAGIAALYLPFIRFGGYAGSAYYGSENLSICLSLAALLILLGRGVGPIRAGVAGVVIGLATLTRAGFFLFPLVMAAWLWTVGGTRPVWKLTVGLMVLVGAAVALGPWIYRNYERFGDVVPVATSLGDTFLGGNSPYARGFSETASGYPEYQWISALYPGQDEWSEHPRNRLFLAEGLSFLRENLLTVAPWLVLRKLYLFIAGFGQTYNLSYVLVLPFALAGLVLSRENPGAWLLGGMVAYHAALAVLLHPMDGRMRLAIEPLLVVFAAYGAWCLRTRLRSWAFGGLIGVWSGLNLYVALHWGWIREVVRG
ncbi:MAG: glycosyltransferase family 39 protein [Deltaproteobacteria bacterium]|nr:glycosyltransferase family 39 protein [Deltaproteobacteria bacterium]